MGGSFAGKVPCALLTSKSGATQSQQLRCQRTSKTQTSDPTKQANLRTPGGWLVGWLVGVSVLPLWKKSQCVVGISIPKKKRLNLVFFQLPGQNLVFNGAKGRLCCVSIDAGQFHGTTDGVLVQIQD